jgi:hypothetical protein
MGKELGKTIDDHHCHYHTYYDTEPCNFIQGCMSLKQQTWERLINNDRNKSSTKLVKLQDMATMAISNNVTKTIQQPFKLLGLLNATTFGCTTYA